jgi:SAM-dependent methyltransferase
LTHPRHLGALGILLGIRPGEVGTARVLELGCASGHNLLPIAAEFPDSRCIGVDASAKQVAVAQELGRELCLPNADFVAADVRLLPADLGEFDFVIAHGVYSWVDAPTRDALLRACRDHLAQNGLAMVSYNTLPGWHQHRAVRDLMRFHGRHSREDQERLRAGREFLTMAAAHGADDDSTYRRILRDESARLVDYEDGYVLHDHLEETNAPCYLLDFVSHASRHGLAYVCDADPRLSSAHGLDPATLAAVKAGARSPVEFEQYLDFLHGRSFRATVLCRTEQPIERRVGTGALANLRLAASNPAAQITSTAPLIAAGFEELRRAWPGDLSFAELCARTKTPADAEQVLERTFLDAFLRGDLTLRAAPVQGTATPRPQPRTTAVARAQAARGLRVTNLLHRSVDLDDFARQVLALLDGTRDVEALTAALRPATGATDGVLRRGLTACLLELGANALLCA